MKICSREYALKFRKDMAGGCFYSNGPNSEGDGVIEIGEYRDLGFVCEVVLHEALEAILWEDGRRLCPPCADGDHSRYVFLFDHDYLDGLPAKLIDALLTSGFFRVVDGRPKRKAKKGGK